MNKEAVKESVESNAVFAFSRSSGPGGQNVNKVASKVLAKVAINSIEGLSPAEMARLRAKSGDGGVFVAVQDERSQSINRLIAVERLSEKICLMARIPKKRRPTKPTRVSKERRLRLKAIRSEIKRARKKTRGLLSGN